MELHDRILEDVGHVQQLALANHLRMLVHHQPADVRKEEAPIRVVRISVRLGELVVHSMVAHPVEQWILAGQRETQHQDNAERCLRLVRSMAPQSMCTAGDTEAAKATHQETY